MSLNCSWKCALKMALEDAVEIIMEERAREGLPI